MWSLKCDRCGHDLIRPGALIFSPPSEMTARPMVEKYHVCWWCWDKLEEWLGKR